MLKNQITVAITFSLDEATKLAEILEKRIGKGSLVNNLKTYFKEHNELALMKLVEENSIEVKQFHFDEY